MTKFKQALIILICLSSLASLCLAYQNLQLQKQISILQSPVSLLVRPSPSPVLNPTSDWKTKNSDIISFKYPANLILEERQKNYFVLLSDQTNPLSVVVSIDARLTGNYTNYDKAVTSTKTSLTDIQTQEIENGIKISGKVGPGYGQGQQITIALFKDLQGAVEAETTTTNPLQLKDFDLILSTFKFTDTGCQYQGKTYQNGEGFKDKCNSCSCADGKVLCTMIACQ